MAFLPLDPVPDVPPLPLQDPEDLSRQDEHPFQFPPEPQPIEPLDPDYEPETGSTAAGMTVRRR